MPSWNTRGPLTWNEPAPRMRQAAGGTVGQELVARQLTKLGWNTDANLAVPGVDLIAYRPGEKNFVTIEVKAPARWDRQVFESSAGTATDRDFTVFVEPAETGGTAEYWVVPDKALVELQESDPADRDMSRFRDRWDLLDAALG